MSEDICLTAFQDMAHPPPRVVPAPVDNLAFSWLHRSHSPQVSAEHRGAGICPCITTGNTSSHCVSR